MKKEPNKYKLTYTVSEGKYEANSMFGLWLEVVKHRLTHLIFDGKWSD